MDNLVIVEVEGYDGEDGSIVVENYRADRLAMGKPHIIYCIGFVDDNRLVQITDWGYATIAEAREAIGFRKAAQDRARQSDDAT
jgi:hypothetical protein